jgi:hypothetical protein
MRATRLSVVLAAMLAAPATAQAPDADPSLRQLLEVVIHTPAEMQQLMALDLDVAGRRSASSGDAAVGGVLMDVIGRPGDLHLLQKAKLRCSVLEVDMAAAHAARVALHPPVNSYTLTPAIGQGAMGGHYTLAEMLVILDGFAAQYPNLCSQRVSIGQSIEGRDLWMVKISDNVAVDEAEPEVLYDALHHAREPMSLGTMLLFMDELLDGYGNDAEATHLINEREMFFIPCVNPDGYEFNRTSSPNGGGLWRKNRRDNGGGTFGVDLNRNYGTGWAAPFGGSSTSPSSSTYRGTAAFSEPESAAVEAFTLTRQFVQVFSVHCYGDVLLHPFGWQPSAPANLPAYGIMGDFLVEENGIGHGSVSGLLYIASGSAVDHHHSAHGSYAWTPELGALSEGGFWPVGPDIELIARRHQPMFRKVALIAGAAFHQLNVQVNEAAGSNGNMIVEPGETAEVVVTIRNQGAAAATVNLQLFAVDPNLVIGSGMVSLGSVASVATVNNTATPLTFSVPANFVGIAAHLVVRVTGDGRTQDFPIAVPFTGPRRCMDDDFERDRGFARMAGGTASTGLWERGAPQMTSSAGTTIQPGTQTTPGGAQCWVTDPLAGASVGANDVDSGYTDLATPIMDLSHISGGIISFDYWYAESAGNDPLVVSVSRDGGSSWSQLFQTFSPTGTWQRLDLPLGSPMTDQMMVRVRAQDQVGSLVEACIDGLAIAGAVADGATTVLGSGVLGTDLRIAGNAPPNSLLVPIASFGLGAGVSIPGVSGTLLLDLGSAVMFPLAVVGGSEYVVFDMALPVLPGLVGLQLAFQSVVATASGIGFGGNAPVITLQ